VQARVVKVEALGDRVAGLAGIKPGDLSPGPGVPATPGAAGATGGPGASAPGRAAPVKPGQPAQSAPKGQGGLYLPLGSPSLEQLQAAIQALEHATDRHGDVLVFAESRLLEARLQALLVPSTAPVEGPVGSGFGFREDPFTGRAALHTGLDFPAEVGTPVRAAAGGVVLAADWHPQYGQTLEIDHGNRLSTLYAHLSRTLVKPGDIVKRGQPIGQVGNTGRSTGAHLHFEVLLEGTPQDPMRFLAGQVKGPFAGSFTGSFTGPSQGSSPKGPVVK
jgi:murein DD-endopeptidase MepM/ murein hydrolase activator NlpD